MTRWIRVALAPMVVIAAAAGSTSGCTCIGGSPDCNGAAVSVDLGATTDAAATQVCVNNTCEVASETSFGNEVEVRFDSVPFVVRDNEDFKLKITVFDEAGTQIASTEQTRNFDVDECQCLSFPYELNGFEVERSD